MLKKFSFPTDYCQFSTEKMWVLKILILLLNFPEMGSFSPKFCIFRGKYLSEFVLPPLP